MDSEAAIAGVRIAANVSPAIADALRDKATAAERSVAAEVRLALKAWVDEPLKNAA